MNNGGVIALNGFLILNAYYVESKDYKEVMVNPVYIVSVSPNLEGSFGHLTVVRTTVDVLVVKESVYEVKQLLKSFLKE